VARKDGDIDIFDLQARVSVGPIDVLRPAHTAFYFDAGRKLAIIGQDGSVSERPPFSSYLELLAAFPE